MHEINRLIEELYKSSSLDSLPVVPLTEQAMEKNPFDQFYSWFKEAADAGIMEPHAMALSTSTVEGIPSSRMLLLKSIDEENNFVFFSHYNSRKGRELEENPHAAMLFYWQQINKQVRIEGDVRKISQEESDEYFQTRVRDSQLNAWVSHQSEMLESREALENAKERMEMQFYNTSIPRPSYWGGYRLEPAKFEFWQRAPNRFHDRIIYQKGENGDWIMSRLFP